MPSAGRVYRIEILPLWAPWAPAVSCLGGGVPGMNGAFGAYAGGRARRRVTPCPTALSAGFAASTGAGAAGAASDRRTGVFPIEVTGMSAPWAASSADSTRREIRNGIHTRSPHLVAATLLPSTASSNGNVADSFTVDERERFLDAVMVRLGERPLLDDVRLNIVARRRQPISAEAEAGRRRAIASDGRAIRIPRSAAAPNAMPTSKNAPPTAIPNSEICSAM